MVGEKRRWGWGSERIGALGYMGVRKEGLGLWRGGVWGFILSRDITVKQCKKALSCREENICLQFRTFPSFC